MTLDLRSHLALNTDLLGHLERESQSLRQLESDRPTSAAEARRDILPRLEEALQRIRNHRSYWLSLSPEVRSTKHEIRDLLRQNQDLIMRMILLDRENEQLLLRRGLIPLSIFPYPASAASLCCGSLSEASPLWKCFAVYTGSDPLSIDGLIGRNSCTNSRRLLLPAGDCPQAAIQSDRLSWLRLLPQEHRCSIVTNRPSAHASSCEQIRPRCSQLPRLTPHGSATLGLSLRLLNGEDCPLGGTDYPLCDMIRPTAWLMLATCSVLLSAAERQFDFSSTKPGTLPEGWKPELAGVGKPGDWRVVEEEVPPTLEPLSPQAPD